MGFKTTATAKISGHSARCRPVTLILVSHARLLRSRFARATGPHVHLCVAAGPVAGARRAGSSGRWVPTSAGRRQHDPTPGSGSAPGGALTREISPARWTRAAKEAPGRRTRSVAVSRHRLIESGIESLAKTHARNEPGRRNLGADRAVCESAAGRCTPRRLVRSATACGPSLVMRGEHHVRRNLACRTRAEHDCKVAGSPFS